MSVFRYPVTKQYIPSLPVVPYRNGVGAYEGVVLHFTDNYTSTIDGEVGYMTSNFPTSGIYVHEFVGPTKAVQIADPRYRAQGAGKYANPRFIHIELCVAKTQAEFDLSYDMWCERAAEYLFANKLGVTPAKADGSGTLWSHHDVTTFLGGTTHEDPLDYLAKWNKTWQNVIDTVSKYYSGLVDDSKPKPPLFSVFQFGNKIGDYMTEGEAAAESVKWDHSYVLKLADKSIVTHNWKSSEQLNGFLAAPSWIKPVLAKLVSQDALDNPAGDETFYRVLAIMDRFGTFDKK